MAQITTRQIDNDGWTPYLGTMPAFVSTTDGVDTLTLTDANTFLQKGTKVEITSTAGTHTYYVSDADATGFDVNGETSVSGTVTAMRYSYADCPFGFKKGEDWYSASLYRSTIYNVPTGAQTDIDVDSAVYDEDTNRSSGGFVAKITGKYIFSIGFGGGNADWSLGISVGGSKIRLLGSHVSNTQGVSGTVTLPLNRGDIAKITVKHFAGSNVQFNAGSASNYLAGQFTGI